ncbi:hypothetical protein [Nocardioides xinjiangensis]|uniref:hypothetical protein n=1 Tax=Nocardioides xinjiangensis TaxID=2817376 RepID=UPI001B30CA17|nr:hypothetical protein [Nocardioides sp. SYSU D00778]
MSRNFWIDDDWWRDWLFWVGAVAAGTAAALSLAITDRSMWTVALGALTSSALTVAVLGFVRTAYRSYREDQATPPSSRRGHVTAPDIREMRTPGRSARIPADGCVARVAW